MRERERERERRKGGREKKRTYMCRAVVIEAVSPPLHHSIPPEIIEESRVSKEHNKNNCYGCVKVTNCYNK
jgi:hypothetical protein